MKTVEEKRGSNAYADDLDEDERDRLRPDRRRPSPGKVTRTMRIRMPIQRKADATAAVDVGADDHIERASSSTGSELPSAVKRSLEQSFGAKLDSVRVHTGAASQTAAESIHARAYTHGQDIHFAAGQYDPTTTAGQHLLAHEVAHTVQQRSATRTQAKPEVSQPSDALERAADRAADVHTARWTGGSHAPVHLSAAPASGGAIQRKAELGEKLDLDTPLHLVFEALVERGGHKVKDAKKTYAAALASTRFRSWGVVFYPDVGEALTLVGFDVPTKARARTDVELIAAVFLFQASKRLSAKTRGVLDRDTLGALHKALPKTEATRSLRKRVKRYGKQSIGGRPLQARSLSKPAQMAAFRKTLIDTPVLGVGFSGPGRKGVNPSMHARLTKAHNALLNRLATALANNRNTVSRLDGKTIIKTADDEGLRHWLGMRQPHGGWSMNHAPTSYHKSGSAVDINYDTNPFFPVRTGNVIGGEGGTTGINKSAVKAIDRAMAFMGAGKAEIHAELGPPLHDEKARRAWAGKQWERFNKVSETVSSYFGLVYDRAQARSLLQAASKTRLNWWRGKPSGRAKLLDENTRTVNLERQIATHNGAWPRNARQMYDQIKRDLLAIARGMVIGKPGVSTTTRNPLLGTFDLKKELVQELAAAGLRWGGCEFGKSSGDMMHFDLGDTPSLKVEEAKFKKLTGIEQPKK